METIHVNPDPATEKLAAEMADVRASIELVSSGVATVVTLTGLRFGRQIAERLAGLADLAGVDVETQPWTDDDSGGDVRIHARASSFEAHLHA